VLFWPLLHVAQHFRSYADYERTDLIVIHDEPRGERPYVNQFGIEGNTYFTLEELFRSFVNGTSRFRKFMRNGG
jgi:hypothetical protein